ncbi:MAG: SGNH/GDSL hydrolase family protein [Bacteroidota bacterium]|nr:SGNH/GDSL hydrolase family protein [Bacteroidota bacterium]
MLKHFIPGIIFFFVTICGIAQPYPIPGNIHRIVFLGNSITYAGNYVTFIDTYLTLQQPGKAYEIINLGLPSETVSGLSEPHHADGRFPRPDLHERLARMMTMVKPDLVFACYGMNDGIYLPFNDDRFAAFRKGIQWLHEQLTAAGIPIIHITPPVFDERKGAAYANVLDIYSDWLLSKRYTDNWQVIDVHGAMKHSLASRRMIDSSFAFAADGVHPDTSGHWVIAQKILTDLARTGIEALPNFHALIQGFPHGQEIAQLVDQKQKITKDAWLHAVGHKRPEMPAALPLIQAQKEAAKIALAIEQLLSH